jgi:hypothetical protein
VIIVSLCFACGALYPENSGKARIIIARLRHNTKNEAGGKNFTKADINRDIIFHSFYSFISIIPLVDTPDENMLTGIQADDSNVSDICRLNNADFVIYGDYSLSGRADNQDLRVTLKVYSALSNNLILKNVYNTATGIEIFDAIDKMTADVIKASLDIDMKNISLIEFTDLKLGREKYILTVNDKLIAEPSGNDFSLNLRALPGQVYHIVLRHDERNESLLLNKNVIDTRIVLAPDQKTNIGYTGEGHVKINGITDKDRNKKYFLMLDGRNVMEGSTLSDITSADSHLLSVYSGPTNIVEELHFDVPDSGIITLTPAEKFDSSLRFRIYSGDNDIGNIGAGWLMARYFRFGLDIGYSYFESYSIISPQLEAGYYILNDTTSDFRILTGITLRMDGVEPAVPGLAPSIYAGEIFLELSTKELWGLFIRGGFYCSVYPAGLYYPTICAGFEF